MQYSVRACSAMAKDSFAQSIGSEQVQFSILAGVIVFTSSLAACRPDIRGRNLCWNGFRPEKEEHFYRLGKPLL
jgi:hypothetical protein